MKIIVTGANGQLGQSFQKVASDYPKFTFHFLTADDLDITDTEAIEKCFSELQPKYLINCAAYTAVDKAESDLELAKRINTTAVEYLAKAAKKYDARLVHYSTDYVYHNDVKTPLKETDPTSPKGVYAKTKLDGEKAIEKCTCDHTIIRTSWVYSEYGHNFVKTMLRLGDRDELRIVNDQIGCPTYAPDIARATLDLLSQQELPKRFTVNYAGDGQISWYDFAVEIFRLLNNPITLHPIPSTEYPTPAERPLWSVMDLDRIRSYGVIPRNWKMALEECISEIG